MRVNRGYERDIIQHPGTTLPTAYYIPSAAFSERFGRLIERITQSTNLLRRIGTGITLGSICILEREQHRLSHTGVQF